MRPWARRRFGEVRESSHPKAPSAAERKRQPGQSDESSAIRTRSKAQPLVQPTAPSGIGFEPTCECRDCQSDQVGRKRHERSAPPDHRGSAGVGAQARHRSGIADGDLDWATRRRRRRDLITSRHQRSGELGGDPHWQMLVALHEAGIDPRVSGFKPGMAALVGAIGDYLTVAPRTRKHTTTLQAVIAESLTEPAVAQVNRRFSCPLGSNDPDRYREIRGDRSGARGHYLVGRVTFAHGHMVDRSSPGQY